MPEVFRSLFLVLEVHYGKTVDLLPHMKEVSDEVQRRQDLRKKLRRVATNLTGNGAATALTTAGTTSAMAGNNGQQVVVETSIGVNAYYLQVSVLLALRHYRLDFLCKVFVWVHDPGRKRNQPGAQRTSRP